MKLIATAVLPVIVVAACSSIVSSQGMPFLPRVAPPPPGVEQVMLAGLIGGELIVDKGCVKLKSAGSNIATTVLWYEGAELVRDENGILLRQSSSGTHVRFGTRANFGGGSAPAAYIEQAYPEVAKVCGGPYAFGYAGGA